MRKSQVRGELALVFGWGKVCANKEKQAPVGPTKASEWLHRPCLIILRTQPHPCHPSRRCAQSCLALAQAAGVPPNRVRNQERYRPNHNLHPGNASLVIVRERGGGAAERNGEAAEASRDGEQEDSGGEDGEQYRSATLK